MKNVDQGASAGHDETPPHGYIPPGPIEAQPWEGGYCQPETRREAFAAVLRGVTTGAYDERMVSWLVGWDDPTCRAVASLMWRCRLAGRAEAGKPGPHTVAYDMAGDDQGAAYFVLTEALAAFADDQRGKSDADDGNPFRERWADHADLMREQAESAMDGDA